MFSDGDTTTIFTSLRSLRIFSTPMLRLECCRIRRRKNNVYSTIVQNGFTVCRKADVQSTPLYRSIRKTRLQRDNDKHISKLFSTKQGRLLGFTAAGKPPQLWTLGERVIDVRRYTTDSNKQLCGFEILRADEHVAKNGDELYTSSRHPI